MRSKLEKTHTLSVAVHIWTDSTNAWLFRGNSPLRGNRVTHRRQNKYTGDRISEKFEDMCVNFNIKHKLDYIICDKASNMKQMCGICSEELNSGCSALRIPRSSSCEMDRRRQKFCRSLPSTRGLKEAFEAECAANRSIPSAMERDSSPCGGNHRPGPSKPKYSPGSPATQRPVFISQRMVSAARACGPRLG